MIPMDVSGMLPFASNLFNLFLTALPKSQLGNGCRHVGLQISLIIITMGSGKQRREGSAMMVAVANFISNNRNNKK
jgi:hypothetical protein